MRRQSAGIHNLGTSSAPTFPASRSCGRATRLNSSGVRSKKRGSVCSRGNAPWASSKKVCRINFGDMAFALDLNCDLGEGAGHDAELMPLVTSVNIACGGHAGDAASMRATMELAHRSGVAAGAHPSFVD